MSHRLRASGCLSFCAGYIDSVGFVALFGLFAAHVTGNFVLIGSELAYPSHGVTAKLLAFPAFIAAVIVARLMSLRVQRLGRGVAGPLLSLQITLLAACMVCGLLAQPVTDAVAAWTLATAVLAAAAMGVQNAAARLAYSTMAPTTVMTGNVTAVVIDLVDLVRGGSDAEARPRAARLVWAIVGFAVGAIGGAFAYRAWSFWALALPLVMLIALRLVQGENGSLQPRALSATYTD